jgi:hypothetical protein
VVAGQGEGPGLLPDGLKPPSVSSGYSKRSTMAQWGRACSLA